MMKIFIDEVVIVMKYDSLKLALQLVYTWVRSIILYISRSKIYYIWFFGPDFVSSPFGIKNYEMIWFGFVWFSLFITEFY